MNLALWDPFREMEELLDKYHKSSRKLGFPRTDEGGLEMGDWMPPVDIEETDNEYLLRLELPGVDKKDISLHVENGMLRIKGEKRSEKEHKDSKVHRYECSYGSFVRSFTLPRGVKTDKFPDAEFKDGVLKLSILKAEESKPKQIDIKIK